MFQKFKTKYWNDKWNIGVYWGKPHDLLDGGIKNAIYWGNSEKIEGSYADPFIIKWQNDYFIFFEELIYKTNKGRLVCSKLTIRDCRIFFDEPKAIFDKDYHMSYPYIFRNDGKIYLCPETAEIGKVTLYKAKRFPYEWKKQKDIIHETNLLDPTIFQYRDLWWLFCTDAKTGKNSHLHIYFSESLLGRWRPHKENPVKVNIRSSRPAGQPFIKDGRLYRPAQNCETTYGQNLVINKILKLSPEEFGEETVKAILPKNFKKYKDGLHHLSYVGDLVIFDAKRFLFTKKYLFSILRTFRKTRNGS